MPNLKRSAIATALTLTLVSGLAACGTNDDAKPAEAATSSTESSSASTSDTEPKGKGTSDSDTGKSPTKSKPSASASPTGPYKPATPKRPAQNVPVPGPLPEVAKEESKAGQVAFIEYWAKEFNYAVETGKLRPEFWEMTSRSCNYCKEVEEALKNMEEQKTWNIGGDITVDNIRPDIEPLEDGIYEVRFSVSETARKRYASGKAKPVEEYPAGAVDQAFVELRRVKGQWRLEGFYQIAN